MINPSINKLNISKIFFLLFLASLFFPIRYTFPTIQAYQTGAYSDFTSISLYLSDILLFLTVLLIFSPRGVGKWAVDSWQWIVNILILWLIIDLISHFSSLTSLNWWFFVKYLELIVAYETSMHLFRETDIKSLFIRVFIILSSFESILALWQFAIQRSVGGILHHLGEGTISPKLFGIAKIVSGETTYIRGYGTFPHPNLLSAFLVVGVMLSIYKLISSNKLKSKFLYSFAIFINLLGLTVTFSRAAFLGLIIGLIGFFGFQLIIKKVSDKKELLRALFITLAGIAICLIIFQPFISTRATVTDSASLERIFYAKIGLRIIKTHPIFGIGIGDSVLHMQQYLPALNFSDKLEILKVQSGGDLTKYDKNKQKFMAGEPIKLQPWEIQPIHNYFLLAAAELGIPGALILIWFFISNFLMIIKKATSEQNLELTTYYLLLTTILCSFLVLMQFDHYFYTLQQTQMLLWVILGIISAEIKKPGTSQDLKS